MSSSEAPLKVNNRQVGLGGKHYVAAELHRRGAHAVTFSENPRENVIFASNVQRTRTVSIQVKTKERAPGRRRHGAVDRAMSSQPGPSSGSSSTSEKPRHASYLLHRPAWWMENSIYVEHEAYIARHGGKRARTPTSTHHAVAAQRLAQWRDHLDLLGIF